VGLGPVIENKEYLGGLYFRLSGRFLEVRLGGRDILNCEYEMVRVY